MEKREAKLPPEIKFENSEEAKGESPEGLSGEKEFEPKHETHETEGNREKIEAIRESIASLDDGEAKESSFVSEIKNPVQEPIRPEGLMQALQKDRLNVLVENARHILGPEASDEQVKDLSRQTFSEYIKALLFSARPRSREKLLEQTDIVGRENLEKALEENKKAIVVTSHMAYFPTAMKMIPDMMPAKTRGTVLVEKNPLWPVINAGRKIGGFFNRQDKEQSRFEMMVKNSKNPRTLHAIINRLKKATSEQREIFYMAADRGDLSPDRRRTEVDIFDSKVKFPTGPTTLSEYTGAPIIPTDIVREGDRFRIRIGDSITLDASLSSEEAANKAMQQVADFFEQGIKEHPEQWPMYRHDYWPGQKGYK